MKLILLTPIFKRFKKSAFFSSLNQNTCPVYAELGVCPAYGHTDCLIMAQGDKSNLLGVAYASVDKGKISGISLCIVPTPDAAERSGIYPGLQSN